MKKFIIFLLVIFAILSCNKLQNSKNAQVYFSNDTVFFDTIFTRIGSTTKAFIVYNNENFPVKIDKIYIPNNDNSKFRLNVDGVSTTNATDITIAAKDSMFIFIEVTINPGTDSILVEDSVIFESGTNRQHVILNAVGKDVHLLNGQILQTQTWTNDKAYLIYNSILIDSLQTLTIEQGVEIYSHYNSAILCKGTIIANGTIDQPIIFRGDRIDDNLHYENKAGQWYGILFLRGTNSNSFNFVKITEGIYGIYVDSMVTVSPPTLTLNNSIINECTVQGLYLVNTNALVMNSIIGNCGINSILLMMSGNYEFYHCTINNFFNSSSRQSSAVAIQNYYGYYDSNNSWKIIYGGNINANFYNSIISGSKDTELIANDYATNKVNIFFKNSLIKYKNINTALPIFQNCLFNVEPDFVDLSKYDYNLNLTSPMINKGNFDVDNSNTTLLRYDMNNTDRLADSKPDIGALDYKKE